MDQPHCKALLVGTVGRLAGHHLVPLGYLVLDGDLQIGKGSQYQRRNCLTSWGPRSNVLMWGWWETYL